MFPIKGRSRASELLSLLPKRGPEAFDIFVEALVKTEQKHLAELLGEDCTANLVKKRPSKVKQETMHSQETIGMIFKQITFYF